MPLDFSNLPTNLKEVNAVILKKNGIMHGDGYNSDGLAMYVKSRKGEGLVPIKRLLVKRTPPPIVPLNFTSDGNFAIYPRWSNTNKTIQYTVNNLNNWQNARNNVAIQCNANDIIYFKSDTEENMNLSNSWGATVTAGKYIYAGGDIMSLYNNSDTVPDFGFYYMFSSWSILKSAPILSAKHLSRYCYMHMFEWCGFEYAPELPATIMAEACYFGMFQNCRNLITAPNLPATTLSRLCYERMFSTCISLTKAPDLPAIELRYRCYAEMFILCNNIKISMSQTGIYQNPWRIPTKGNAIIIEVSPYPNDPNNHWSSDMLLYTGGTFTDNPVENITYYQAE